MDPSFVLKVSLTIIIGLNCFWGSVTALPPKARILVQYPLSESDNSSAIQVLNDVEDTDTILTEPMIGGNIYLECVASYPIEWTYEGDGFPDLLTFLETRRVVRNFSDPSTYTFSARVDLLSVKEKNTGLYSCRKLGTPQVKAFFYIYVPGKNVFLSDTSTKVTADIHNEETVTLPCVITNPSAKIILFRLSDSGSLDRVPDVPFDPSKGFRLNIRANEGSVFGHYICMAVKEKKVLKVLVEAPKGYVVRVIPTGKHVAKKHGGLNQVFKCEAKENVTIRVSESGESQNFTSRQIFDQNSTFQYITTLEITSDKSNLEKSHTLITCATVEGNKILHSWEYTSFGDDDDIRFSYNSTLNLFLCCTSSFHRPEISRISCTSPMECQMKKHYCIRNKEKCSEHQQYNSEGIPEGCVAYSEPEDHKEDGMFQCSIGEMIKEFYFAWGNNKSSNPILSFDQIESNKEIIEIITNHTGNIIAGEEVEISCHPSRFFFSSEPVWAFEKLNGTIEIVDKTLLRDDLYFEKRITIPKRRRTVKFPYSDIKSLLCFAPTWYSASEWRNVSIPVTVLETPINLQLLKDMSLIRNPRPDSTELVSSK